MGEGAPILRGEAFLFLLRREGCAATVFASYRRAREDLFLKILEEVEIERPPHPPFAAKLKNPKASFRKGRGTLGIVAPTKRWSSANRTDGPPCSLQKGKGEPDALPFSPLPR